MNTSLTDSDKAKLKAKFQAFRKVRDDLNIFLVSYIADFMMLQNDEPSKRKRYLRRKYGSLTPRINYQFNTVEGFYWSVRNIAIVLGRNRSSIIRVLTRMQNSDYWRRKTAPLRRVIHSYEGGNIDVYHKDIFDVLMDYYEEEYLLRFARPRHGNAESAPGMSELRRFWRSLRGQECAQKRVLLPTGVGVLSAGLVLPAQENMAKDTWLRRVIDWFRRLTC